MSINTAATAGLMRNLGLGPLRLNGPSMSDKEKRNESAKTSTTKGNATKEPSQKRKKTKTKPNLTPIKSVDDPKVGCKTGVGVKKKKKVSNMLYSSRSCDNIPGMKGSPLKSVTNGSKKPKRNENAGAYSISNSHNHNLQNISGAKQIPSPKPGPHRRQEWHKDKYAGPQYSASPAPKSLPLPSFALGIFDDEPIANANSVPCEEGDSESEQCDFSVFADFKRALRFESSGETAKNSNDGVMSSHEGSLWFESDTTGSRSLDGSLSGKQTTYQSTIQQQSLPETKRYFERFSKEVTSLSPLLKKVDIPASDSQSQNISCSGRQTNHTMPQHMAPNHTSNSLPSHPAFIPPPSQANGDAKGGNSELSEMSSNLRNLLRIQ
eukprot:Nk52_evm7s1837 gene=Nk52_evmTU7s1837